MISRLPHARGPLFYKGIDGVLAKDIHVGTHRANKDGKTVLHLVGSECTTLVLADLPRTATNFPTTSPDQVLQSLPHKLDFGRGTSTLTIA